MLDLAGGFANPHPASGPLPWGSLAGLFLLVLALLAVLAGVTASGRLLRGAGKPGQHRAGPLLMLAGAAMIALGVWTW